MPISDSTPKPCSFSAAVTFSTAFSYGSATSLRIPYVPCCFIGFLLLLGRYELRS